ncbi:acylneuraminate cytidylyltransferase family protein [Pseudoalteromonas sp. 1_2015MBL_MicDiv]|uniref:acylneuraminate cytidylyltransferase family protein n=1 Tax=Pseudoalteromonas sp. 1_2015MBL_MicDiv TaxID=1720343 RepID=UPI000BBEC2E3|nr:acylneuraminate cytidylyltransferase family protein [Pseudoalteromonas sp. 1_2015MBL_MicDiv]ATG76498.1 acylneuraminate cytidylyltransferase [Pseudoalteromonas sp. 1_2015MBL_MicDiv]
MKNFAFIFARGGSKGLPGKNIRPLLGKPLIEYSIDIAKSSTSIDKVFVSTDDNEIAKIAADAGVEVIFRPNELATDKSPEWLAWRHAIEHVKQLHGEFDNFISLPATSPLRSLDDVETAILKRVETKADICISVVEASRSPFFNMVKQSKNGFFELVNKPESSVERRQDAPKVYDITTVVYAASPSFIMSNYGLFSGNVTSIEVPKERAVDIDDIYDFLLAEAILKKGLSSDS